MGTRKRYSLRRKICFYLLILGGVIVLIILSFGYYSINVYKNQVAKTNRLILNVYAQELKDTLNDIDTYMLNVFGNNQDFKLLMMDINPVQLFQAKYALRNTLSSKISVSRKITGLYIINFDKDVFICERGANHYTTYGMQQMDEMVKSYMKSEKITYDWQILNSNGHAFLFKTYGMKNTFISTAIDLNEFLFSTIDEKNLKEAILLFFNKEGILTNRELLLQDGDQMEHILAKEDRQYTHTDQYIVQSMEISNVDIGLCILTPRKLIWQYRNIAVLLTGTVSLCFIGVVLLIYQQMKRIMLYPLKKIEKVSKQLQEQDNKALYMEEETLVSEFQIINEALYGLMNQNMLLEEDNLKKEREKEHAVLQYYQLQTEPHFFLNCLKNIYAMAAGNEMERIQTMILSFSRHMRYVFHDTLQMVELRSELEATRDYFEILKMNTDRPLMLMQTVDEDLLDCKVPLLIIQTFVENSYKYALTENGCLQINLTVNKQILEEKEFIQFQISDNGKGFNQEALDNLNGHIQKNFEEQHIGISNLKNRILLLYGTDTEFAFFNKRQGGASVVIVIPLKREEM